MSGPSFPTPSFIDSGGVQLAVYEAGAPSQMPPLVFCHGFPDIAYTWRNQFAGLSARGFRTLALDQRGYGASDRPTAVEAYDMAALTGDLIALLDARGIERAVFVGHDWGGLIVWQMPLRHPDRVAGIIALNTPYTKKPPIDPIALYRKRFGEQFYIVRFNTDDSADRAFEADVGRTLRFFLRRPAAEQPAGDGRAGADMLAALAAYGDDADDAPLLTPDELAIYVAAFNRTGFTPAINWYRNFTRNWEHAPETPDFVPHPALMIMAGRDAVLPPSATDGMEKYVPNLEKRLIAQSGHWTQQEHPETVNAFIADWMTRTFGPDGPQGLAAGAVDP